MKKSSSDNIKNKIATGADRGEILLETIPRFKYGTNDIGI